VSATDRLTILVIGGYGTFGRRLVTLLADDARLEIIVAGRSVEKAAAVCAQASEAEIVAERFDRDGDVAAQLGRIRPDLVVDAAGPYQLYGGDPYRVVKAALDIGAHYLDLADATDFVQGIKAFQADALAADRFVLSGASTFAALSGAVMGALAGDLDEVSTVEGGLALSPRAPLGFSIIQAIASYAGKPVGQTDGVRRYALTDARNRVIAVPGTMPLPNVTFSLVDVPDLEILPERWPGLKSVWIGVGTRPRIFHFGMIAAAWLVRLRLLPALTWLARPMHFVSRTFTWGDHRSGMYIHVEGRRDGRKVSRRWVLVADGDAGPNIPVMAAAVAVRRLAEGMPLAAGARAADRDFELADYQPWFDRFGIRSAIVEEDGQECLPLYHRILGPAYATLDAPVRDAHDFTGSRDFSGRAHVSRGTGILSRMIAALIGFPDAGKDIPLKVTLSATAERETWQRDFDGQRFRSEQFAGSGRNKGLLMERFGLLTFGLGLIVEGDRLRLIGRNWSIFGVPLPKVLMPKTDAYEDAQDGRFNFHVRISLPVAGFIVAYEGWLEPVKQAEPRSSAA
jgi:NAD(P)-dependent dehydrogenase (short-subunit alcohol dehydrogenase family)